MIRSGFLREAIIRKGGFKPPLRFMALAKRHSNHPCGRMGEWVMRPAVWVIISDVLAIRWTALHRAGMVSMGFRLTPAPRGSA
jgi:hypothetical protein